MAQNMTTDLLEFFNPEAKSVLSHVARLLIVYALTLPIGWTQERFARGAGIRTFPLVAMASCGLVMIGTELLNGDIGAESRILAGIITGIGFIGGGAILRTSENIHGSATAASIWNTAVIGAAVGYGVYDIALVLSVTNVLTLRLLLPLKNKIAARIDRQPPI